MDARTARLERRRDQAREEILAATREVLLEGGVGALTLAAVARRVGLTKAALYYYFPSKEALAFELMVRYHVAEVEVIEAAVARAKGGTEAVEALVRSVADYYAERMDEFRLSYMQRQMQRRSDAGIDSQIVERIRPLNDRLYRRTAELVLQDQERGRANAAVDGRRLAFVAHMSVIGVLAMEAYIDSIGDAPLVHSHAAMVEELVQSFRARLAPGPAAGAKR